jgi:putative DNA primase/helicase
MAMPLAEPNFNPFKLCKDYREYGWLGTIPIPHGKKHPPPKGYTGASATYPEDAQIDKWLKHNKANIALRLSKVSYAPKDSPYGAKEYEVIGLDVDNYREKNGYDQLQALEKKLGPLPKTVRSSSRWQSGDTSAIHLFLVPAGYHFLGKAAKCIDVIQHGHRYMMVWPSINPDADNALYRFRDGSGAYYNDRPGAGATGTPVGVPPLSDLAILPETWFDFLTCNRMLATPNQEISDLSGDELLSWAQEHFNDSADEMCWSMANAVEKKVIEIEENDDSHPIMLSAHWHILSLAAEGHSGWITALRTFNNKWAKATAKRRDSGDFETLQMEIQRSVVGTLSKIHPNLHEYVPDDTCKATVTALHESADNWTPVIEGPAPLPAAEIDDLGPVIGKMYRDGTHSPGEYDQNDHGNAKHFVDLYGDDIKYVDSRRNWILWDGERWNRDVDEKLAARAYSVVEKRQKLFSQTFPRNDPSSVKKAETWRKWGLRSGNAVQIKNALSLAKTLYVDDKPVALSGKEFDVKPNLLGCDNGVLILSKDPYLRPAKKEDYVTYNTHVPYVPWDTEAAHEAGMLEGFKLWQEYLDTFLPDILLRKFIQKTLGHLIIGENPEKLIVFVYGPHDTGKSTMLGGLSSALGDYFGTVDANLFKNRDLNPNLIRAVPLRVAGMSEVDGTRLDASMVKRLTGNDRVTAEAKFSNEIFEGRPQFTAVVACNTEPNIVNADEAIQERILVLPFEYQISTDRRRYDRQVDIERNSGVAVLSWLVEGWKMYCREGLNRNDWPLDVKRLCGSVTGHLNSTQAFVAECIDKNSPEAMEARQKAFFSAQKRKRAIPTAADWATGWTPSTAQVYELYLRWCTANGERAISLHDLTKELGMGNPQVKSVDGRSTRCYVGFRLRTPEES